MGFNSGFKGLNGLHYVRFEVLIAVTVKVSIFWDVTPCNLACMYKNFRGTCCLHLLGRRI